MGSSLVNVKIIRYNETMSKRLGQNFLKNKKDVEKIIKTINVQKNDVIIEIGPGNGSLTTKLADYKKIKIIGIEKDFNLAQELNKELEPNFIKNQSNLQIIEGDALKIIPKITKTYHSKYKILGNIPYYITGKLFRILEKIEKKPEIIVLTVQKEVVERVSAKPPKMNILAASVQIWGDVKIIDYIPKTHFNPIPKVDSAIIKITPLQKNVDNSYYKIMKILFKHPRKTILNNLHIGLDKNKTTIIKELEKININPQIRPERLTIQAIQKIKIML